MSEKANKKGPIFKSGDTVRVHVKVVEGESERVQVFEGVVIRRRGNGIGETFTVRKISFGIGVERVFPIESPRIAKIQVTRSGKSRRSRLYYLRKLSGKAARLSEDKGALKSATSSMDPMKPSSPFQRFPMCRIPEGATFSGTGPCTTSPST